MIYSELKQLNTKRDNLRWNGWGSMENDFFYLEKMSPILQFIRRETSAPELVTPSLRIMDLKLPESKIKGTKLSNLQRIVGKNRVKTDSRERVIHSVGRSYFDVMRLRLGLLKNYPDAIVYPETEIEIEKILKVSAQNNWAVIPFGGGSSVVGGVEARAPGKKAILTIDMTRMNRLIELNPTNHTATFEAGIYGPDLEIALGKLGWTLGHFPQSFEYSTLGGWVAARSAGQQSNRYGKIEDLVTAMRMVTPRGLVRTEAFPAAATGPSVNQIICGSEGSLGVISSVTIKIHELPTERSYCGFLFPDFETGLNFIRTANQQGLDFATLRLSDLEETRLLETFGRIVSHKPEPTIIQRIISFVKNVIQNTVLHSAGLSEKRCVVIGGADGEHSKESIKALKKLASKMGGLHAGSSPGRNWLRGRFNMPFLRNHIMEFGIGVDTLETAVPYDRCHAVHDAVLDAMGKVEPGSLRMCHASHSYPNGACLYFTIMFPMSQTDALEQWHKIKKAASDAIVANGGNISHHHGVGVDHKSWYQSQTGPTAMEALTALKKSLDPRGNMNPGKLI